MDAGVPESFGINVFEQVVASRGMVLFVLLLLIAMSLVCWFIIGVKAWSFRKMRRQTEEFIKAFWHAQNLDEVRESAHRLSDSPLSRMFSAAYTEMKRNKEGHGTSGPIGVDSDYGFENVERTLRRAVQEETTRLEKLTPFLATTGSAAPFIGLFGTVWGIMNAFAFISPDRPVLETVTPHIAQALVATAIGLLAAIPAVMAFNLFNSKIRVLVVEMENFSIDFLNILKRHFFRER